MGSETFHPNPLCIVANIVGIFMKLSGGTVDSAVQRNARTIARAQSFRDDEQNRRREELQRRIEETRKKLQNVSQK